MKTTPENRNMPSLFPKVISELKGIAIFMIDMDGIIISWNDGCKQMKGYRSEEVIGKHFEMLFPDDLREKNLPEESLRQAKNNGRYETENYRKKKNGELYWVHEILTKVTDEKEKFVGFAMITQDLSIMKLYQDELKETNTQLEKTNKELISVNADLDNFVYTASHDLKSPISNIEGLVSTLETELSVESSKNPDIKNIMNMILNSIGKLRSNISEMAITARIDSENKENSEQSLKEIMKDIKHSLYNQIKESYTIFHEELTVPSIKFSRKNLRSIFYNIISNAIKYRSEERPPVIMVKTQKVNEFILISIEDNGQGIKEEDKKKVFAIYQRLDKHVEGTGVGMAIVAKIVNDNGGKIEIESKVGKGSVFKIYLKCG